MVGIFTGLVATTGTVRALERTSAGVRLRIDSTLASELEPGASVAVNGVCLTAVEVSGGGFRGGGFRADVMEETLRRSSLARLAPGDPVNLELPLRPSDRLGGHMVQGHVDGLGSVTDVGDDATLVRIACAGELLRYVVEKGSIAVDGVSLTVAEVDDDGFSVSLIPETRERTTLGSLSPERVVNLEVDVLAKYVEKLMVRA